MILAAPAAPQTAEVAAEAPQAADAAAGEQAPIDLLPVPYPDMSGLEEAVKDQLNEAHGDLQGWLKVEGPPKEKLAAAFARLGELLHAYELYDAAEACYVNVARLQPRDFRWPYYLGHVYQKSGKYEKATEAYRAALAREPANVAAHVHLGEVYHARNLLDEAAAELHRALELAPEEPAARALLGEIALAQGEHAEAVKLLSGVLEQVPAADRLQYPLAMAYRGLGELDKAREHLAKSGTVGIKVADPLIDALESLATGERVHLLRGRQAFAAGHYGEAASEFRMALAADPRSVRVRVNLGSALGQMGDVVGAIEQYEAALGLNPANVTAHFNLGVLRAQQGDFETAAKHFRAATELKNDDGEAHRQLGLALERLDRPEEALESLSSAVLLQPLDENVHLDKAVLLVRLQRYKKALETLEEAHRLLPQSGGVTHALARLLAGSPDRSLRDGERALDLASRVQEALPTPGHAATVAMALAELGRCSEAAEWLGGAVDDAGEQGLAEWAKAQRGLLERYQAGSPCD